ncbi:MAG: hypothetical protein ACYCYI_01785 [Saccharofermentanales bacterium]
MNDYKRRKKRTKILSLVILASVLSLAFSGCNYFWPDDGGNKVVLAPTVFTAKYNYYTEPVKLGDVIKTVKADMRYNNEKASYFAFVQKEQFSMYQEGDKGVISFFIKDSKRDDLGKFINLNATVTEATDDFSFRIFVKINDTYDQQELLKAESGVFTKIVAKKENVIAVPKIAIKKFHQKTLAGVLINGVHVDKEVVVGLEGDETVEIKSGLTLGEALLFK